MTDDPADGGTAGPTTPPGSPSALRLALRRFFGSRGMSDADTDDLLQEVFLRILRRGPTADVENLEAYALTIAGNLLVDRHRQNAHHREKAHAEFHSGSRGVEDLSPERILAGRQALRVTTRALLELPERQRRVFIMRRMEGMAFAEIARRLGISVSSAEKDMQHATLHVITRAGDYR